MPYKDKERTREYIRQRRASHVKNGLCIDCNQPLAKGSKSRCLLHLDRCMRARRKYYANAEYKLVVQEYSRARYYKLKAENRCVRCGKPLDDESRIGARCINCYEQTESYE